MTDRPICTEQAPGPQACPGAENRVAEAFDRLEWAAKVQQEVLYLQRGAQQIDAALRRLQLLQRNTGHTGLPALLMQEDLDRLVSDIEKYRCELEGLNQKITKLEQGRAQSLTDRPAPAPGTRNETGR